VDSKEQKPFCSSSSSSSTLCLRWRGRISSKKRRILTCVVQIHTDGRAKQGEGDWGEERRDAIRASCLLVSPRLLLFSSSVPICESLWTPCFSSLSLLSRLAAARRDGESVKSVIALRASLSLSSSRPFAGTPVCCGRGARDAIVHFRPHPVKVFRIGRVIVKVDPLPFSLATETVPPWASMECLTMERPRPEPRVARTASSRER